RPLRVVRAPAAPPAARPTLPGCAAAPLAPWTLLDAAAALHVLDDPLGLLALAAGVPVTCHAPGAAFAGWGATRDMPSVPRRPGPARDATDLFAALIAGTRCADPFRGRPWTLLEALRQLADWRIAEAENRRIVVCCGMAFWKRRRIAAALASEAGRPAFRRGARAAVAAAAGARRGAADPPAIAVWATRVPPGLPHRAAAAGLSLLYVEDGFVRSAGLGAGFLPGASLVLDTAPGLHLDPAAPSRLERLLAEARPDPALLARAAALRAALLARGVTKYGLGGPAALDLGAPPGARRVLVPGQVEDDLSVRLGAAAVRGNLDLLRAARAAAGPDAFLVFKPHPDVVAGYRRGHVPLRDALRFADRVLPEAPMAALLAAVDEVHTITSLAGFEALLRGLRVVCWGAPFYAGWGLTEDRAPLPRARRNRILTVDELVAISLILYPRYVDPLLELPCPVEVVLDRLADPAAWRPGAIARLRRWQGRARAAFRRWSAAEGA
ncbi:capsular polysaccharide export protein, LipB/KpsS family, partial [Caldovatus aquaticus]